MIIEGLDAIIKAVVKITGGGYKGVQASRPVPSRHWTSSENKGQVKLHDGFIPQIGASTLKD